jgi:AraC family transcriptional regulator
MHQRLPEGQFYGQLVRRQDFAGLHLTETRYTAGTRLPRHCHEHAYFCLVRRGSYREEYAGRQRSCGPLTLAFHPAEELHSESFDGDVRSFNLSLTPVWLRRMPDRVLPLEQPSDFRGTAAVDVAVRLYEEFVHADSASPLIIEGLTLELLGQCVRATGRTRFGAAPGWLRRVRDALVERCAAPPSLGEVAAEAGVHPGYLATAFRRHFGCTLGEHVRRQRVALACRHLAASDLSLAEIALAAGFADQSHFTRVFKRQVGLTPAAYRKGTGRPDAHSKS